MGFIGFLGFVGFIGLIGLMGFIGFIGLIGFIGFRVWGAKKAPVCKGFYTWFRIDRVQGLLWGVALKSQVAFTGFGV